MLRWNGWGLATPPVRRVGKMSGAALIRLLFDLRYGTEGSPDKIARRLRTVNIGTRFAAASHAFFAVVTLVDVTRFWWLVLWHIVAILLFAGVPLLHRRGPWAGSPPSSCSIRRYSPSPAWSAPP